MWHVFRGTRSSRLYFSTRSVPGTRGAEHTSVMTRRTGPMAGRTRDR